MVTKKGSKKSAAKKAPAKKAVAKKDDAKASAKKAVPGCVVVDYRASDFREDKFSGICLTKAGREHAQRLAGNDMEICRGMATLWLRATAIRGARKVVSAKAKAKAKKNQVKMGNITLEFHKCKECAPAKAKAAKKK